MDDSGLPSTTADRLLIAAEQLGFAARAIACMAELPEADRLTASPHAARLESRAAELMRAATCLARDLGLESAWGLDILFGPVDAPEKPSARPVRGAIDPAESVELEPLQLLGPLGAPPRPTALPAPPIAALTPPSRRSRPIERMRAGAPTGRPWPPTALRAQAKPM